MNALSYTGRFFRYAALPGFRPRLQNLFASGFHHVAYFIALIYEAVRLLPKGHPYINPVNLGKFGIRHVVAEAANNLEFRRENIDQILVFSIILIGLVLIFVQIFLLAIAVFLQPALAQQMPTSFAGFFLTPEATRGQDLAMIFLDMVFGLPGVGGAASFFESCVASAQVCQDISGDEITTGGLLGGWILDALGFPYPIHQGLHQMFQLYSIGLLVIGAMITAYFMMTVVAETMQTGTPFGKRFNKTWAPLRIVIAFGLLVPVGAGLNASQYTVLYAAKFGSGFATNGWNLFNDTLVGSYLGQTENLISRPNVPEVGSLLQFLFTARTCAELEQIRNNRTIRAYIVRDSNQTPSSVDIRFMSYEMLIGFLAGEKQAIVRFGAGNIGGGVDDETSQNPGFMGGIRPICGELVMPLTDPRAPGVFAPLPGVVTAEPGPEIMQRYYWYLIFELWNTVFDYDPLFGGTLPEAFADIAADYPWNYSRNFARRFTQWQYNPNLPLPPSDYRTALQNFYIEDLEAAMIDPDETGIDAVIGPEGALPAQMEAEGWALDPDAVGSGEIPPIREKGWAAAGIWYNKVAELNGSVTTAILNMPIPSKYPEIMEYVYLKKRQQDQNVPILRRFEPVMSNNEDVLHRRPEDQQMAIALWNAFDYWQTGGLSSTSHTAPTKNFFVDAVNMIFGTEGLFSMRKNDATHPLAQLVGLGRSLVEAAVRNLGFAAFSGGVSGLGSYVLDSGTLGTLGSLGVSFFMMVATTTLIAGFILFYVIPFMPFIYFFFAVGGWVKGIFEAMVGAPLWALAHIRIDGEGLPGPAALGGYFLIFEVFLRPILIVFGLLASISVFAAMVSLLNEIWPLVTSNLSGFDARTETLGGISNPGGGIDPTEPLRDFQRNPIDEFFFTIVYTIVAYLMAMSSFKLIDQIPDNILRWMGQSVSTFNDQRDDPAQGLVGQTYVGGKTAIDSIGGGMEKALQGMAKSKGG